MIPVRGGPGPLAPMVSWVRWPRFTGSLRSADYHLMTLVCGNTGRLSLSRASRATRRPFRPRAESSRREAAPDRDFRLVAPAPARRPRKGGVRMSTTVPRSGGRLQNPTISFVFAPCLTNREERRERWGVSETPSPGSRGTRQRRGCTHRGSAGCGRRLGGKPATVRGDRSIGWTRTAPGAAVANWHESARRVRDWGGTLGSGAGGRRTRWRASWSLCQQRIRRQTAPSRTRWGELCSGRRVRMVVLGTDAARVETVATCDARAKRLSRIVVLADVLQQDFRGGDWAAFGSRRIAEWLDVSVRQFERDLKLLAGGLLAVLRDEQGRTRYSYAGGESRQVKYAGPAPDKGDEPEPDAETRLRAAAGNNKRLRRSVRSIVAGVRPVCRSTPSRRGGSRQGLRHSPRPGTSIAGRMPTVT